MALLHFLQFQHDRLSAIPGGFEFSMQLLAKNLRVELFQWRRHGTDIGAHGQEIFQASMPVWRRAPHNRSGKRFKVLQTLKRCGAQRQDYSSRNASVGSTRMARYAGT